MPAIDALAPDYGATPLAAFAASEQRDQERLCFIP
jgi:hypothetical protein